MLNPCLKSENSEVKYMRAKATDISILLKWKKE